MSSCTSISQTSCAKLNNVNSNPSYSVFPQRQTPRDPVKRRNLSWKRVRRRSKPRIICEQDGNTVKPSASRHRLKRENQLAAWQPEEGWKLFPRTSFREEWNKVASMHNRFPYVSMSLTCLCPCQPAGNLFPFFDNEIETWEKISPPNVHELQTAGKLNCLNFRGNEIEFWAWLTSRECKKRWRRRNKFDMVVDKIEFFYWKVCVGKVPSEEVGWWHRSCLSSQFWVVVASINFIS